MDPEAPANPCGLISFHYFKDRFDIKNDASATELKFHSYDIDGMDIAHAVDDQVKFKNLIDDPEWEKKQYRDHTDCKCLELHQKILWYGIRWKDLAHSLNSMGKLMER